MVAKKSKGVASLNPDNMASAGLADDFDGVITKARFAPWNYNGTADRYSLGAHVTIKPDEESGLDEFTQVYSAGDLELFAPSVDGEEPVDLEGWDEDDISEVEGIYAYQVGRREQLSNSSNFADFISKLVAAGFDGNNIEANIDFLEGISGHFNRVPQRKRSGIVQTDSEDRQKTILVLTDYAGSAAPAAKSKAKGKAAASDGDDDLSGQVTEAIVAALSEAGGELGKRKLAGVIIKAFKGSKSKSAAVKMASDTSFLADSDQWTFDEDEGLLYEA